MSSLLPVNSYYLATQRQRIVRPSLQENLKCDVCVVGGGIAGCSTALHLSERGYNVILLEQQWIGFGASGRSGAQVIPGVSCGQSALTQLLGLHDAKTIWDLTVAGIDLMRLLIQTHAIDCDWVDGHLQVALKERQARELCLEQQHLQKSYNYAHLQYLDRTAVADLLATERYCAGLYDSRGGHLHSLNYTAGLAAAAEKAGVRIFEYSRAMRYDPHPHLRVYTAQGSVSCKYLAMCGNALLGDLAPVLQNKIIPVTTYIVATEPLGATVASDLIKNNTAVSDCNWIIDYFRRSADHRLLFGGRVNYSGLKSFDAPAVTRHRMLRVFPQLADAQIEYAWGGELDITMNRAPHFGRLDPHLYFLQGFSGHGIALTGIAGKLLADAIAGTAEKFDVFSKIPHRDFPGGSVLRRPLLVLAMLYYRLRDLL
jgi:gamma-glutamylputrescine oxidase